MEKKETNIGSIIQWVSDMTNLVVNHGVGKILSSCMTLCLCVLMITVTLNPTIVVEKITEYIEEVDTKTREFRKNNDPLIRSELSSTLYALGADRIAIMEFHNGKKNPGNLGFEFVDMTYEEVPKGESRVADSYQNVNLSLLRMSTVLYQDGYWYGTVDELHEMDPMLAEKIEKNGTQGIAFLLLEGTSELGILEISYSEIPDVETQKTVGREIRRMGSHISGGLDFKAHNK